MTPGNQRVFVPFFIGSLLLTLTWGTTLGNDQPGSPYRLGTGHAAASLCLCARLCPGLSVHGALHHVAEGQRARYDPEDRKFPYSLGNNSRWAWSAACLPSRFPAHLV